MKNKKINISCIGCGTIGAGWVARLIQNGISVKIYDPTPLSKSRLHSMLENSKRAYQKLFPNTRITFGTFEYYTEISPALENIDFIIESVPERINIKQGIYEKIENQCSPKTLIASSTSGIKPSDLQEKMIHPERLIVAHPFNPVYLIPMVEVVGGSKTELVFVKKACDFFKSIFMKPVHIKKEIEAFVADRLLEAIWRESLWLIKDGICTTQELDDIVRYGFGLRYAQMGVFQTYRTAAGEGGMRQFLHHFGPCLSWPWTKLMNVPEFNDELIDLISSQSDEQAEGKSITDLERIRDDNLVEIQKALEKNDYGAGTLIKKAKETFETL